MDRIKRAFKNLSIKKTFMLYMLLFLLLAAVLSSISINFAGKVRNNINLSYADSSSRVNLENSKGQILIAIPPADYTSKDKVIINICGFVEIWSIPVFFGICIILSALLFYRNKLKKPIEILNEASEKIAGSNLDFHISCDSKDEMGRLCSSFEIMRASLEENNRVMWRSMEERKRLNSVFSHDLRTPLTVIRGYSDFLKNYLPQGKVSEEKLISTVSVMSGQIARMEKYVQMMSEVQRLEDISVSMENVDISFFLEQIKNTVEVLAGSHELKINFINEIPKQEICMDSAIVSRVLENLIANAVRYAENRISICSEYSNGKLTVRVSDDGKGFTDEDLKQAVKPYYRNQSDSGEFHFGLGLYICRILCEKHKGCILIENDESGGASVTASFLCYMEH
ncbi:MAG: HAMP domain-containing histidine kinase [Bacillota bacterium]|nr:HAMP domain-containing histidine kinase [Bacillota bacterium]